MRMETAGLLPCSDVVTEALGEADRPFDCIVVETTALYSGNGRCFRRNFSRRCVRCVVPVFALACAFDSAHVRILRHE
eukprot:m.313274 g.313274  ORF g.313274 m.313274 type:complete len:78 (+) comp372567_c0_seq1:198-431(+)